MEVKSKGDISFFLWLYSDICLIYLFTSTMLTRNIFFNNVSHIIKHHKHIGFDQFNSLGIIFLFTTNK